MSSTYLEGEEMHSLRSLQEKLVSDAEKHGESRVICTAFSSSLTGGMESPSILIAATIS